MLFWAWMMYIHYVRTVTAVVNFVTSPHKRNNNNYSLLSALRLTLFIHNYDLKLGLDAELEACELLYCCSPQLSSAQCIFLKKLSS